MDPTLTVDLIWWITVVELPALAGLFWLIWRVRHDGAQALEAQRQRIDGDLARLCQELAAYKLDVATSYASVASLNAVERRLVAHLLRIEAKLDRTPVALRVLPEKGDLS